MVQHVPQRTAALGVDRAALCHHHRHRRRPRRHPAADSSVQRGRLHNRGTTQIPQRLPRHDLNNPEWKATNKGTTKRTQRLPRRDMETSSGRQQTGAQHNEPSDCLITVKPYCDHGGHRVLDGTLRGIGAAIAHFTAGTVDTAKQVARRGRNLHEKRQHIPTQVQGGHFLPLGIAERALARSGSHHARATSFGAHLVRTCRPPPRRHHDHRVLVVIHGPARDAGGSIINND